MDWLVDPQAWIALATLTALEIVLGIDNIIFITILAIVISVGVMLFAAQTIGDYVEQHPTIKILALSFLLLVGFTLMGEGMGLHIPKGYIYFAMAFSLGVEVLNIRVRARSARPVKLHRVPEQDF